MYEDKVPESLWAHSRWRRSARRLWKSAYEEGDQGRPLGVWVAGESVALARFDRVEAYGLTTGEPRWTWQPPGEQVIALVSRGTREGSGVVLHHDDGARRAKHAHLTALDLDTGKVLWSRKQDRSLLGYMGAYRSEVALEDSHLATAVSQDSRWQVQAVDPHTGERQWKRPLPERVSEVSVLAADPVVASTKGRGQRARRRLYIVNETAGHSIELPLEYTEFGPDVAVAGGTLAVQLIAPERQTRTSSGATLGGFSATTGEPLWEWRSKQGSSLFPLAHRGHLLVLHGYGDRVSVLDPADGRTLARRRLAGSGFGAHLTVSGDCLAVVCMASDDTRRLRVFRWK